MAQIYLKDIGSVIVVGKGATLSQQLRAIAALADPTQRISPALRLPTHGGNVRPIQGGYHVTGRSFSTDRELFFRNGGGCFDREQSPLLDPRQDVDSAAPHYTPGLSKQVQP